MAGAGAGAPSPPPGVYIQQLSALPVAPEVSPPWPSAGEQHAPGDVEAPNAARGVQVTPRRSPRSPRARVVSQAGLYAVRKQKCYDGPAIPEDYDHECRLAAFLCCSCDFGRDPERWSWWGCARHPSRRPWATATQGYMPCSPLHFLEFLLLYAPIFIIAFLQVLPYLGVIETRAGELYAEWVQVKIKPAAMGATTLANAVYLLLPLPAMLLLALRRCSDAVGLPEMPPWQRRAVNALTAGRFRIIMFPLLLCSLLLLLVPVFDTAPQIMRLYRGSLDDALGGADLGRAPRAMRAPVVVRDYLLRSLDTCGPWGCDEPEHTKHAYRERLELPPCERDGHPGCGEIAPRVPVPRYRRNLYLNVYEPDEDERPESGCGVYLWAHEDWAAGSFDLPARYRFLLEAGYCVVSYQYSNPLHGFRFEHMRADTVAAWQWLRDNAARFGFDTQRGFVFGGEGTGATLAAHAAHWIHANLDVDMAASVRAVFDLRSEPTYIRTGGDPWRAKSYICEIDAGSRNATTNGTDCSAETWFRRGGPATVSLYGASDTAVDLGQVRERAAALEAAGIKGLQVYLAGAAHEVDRGYYSLGGQVARFMLERLMYFGTVVVAAER